MRVSLRSWLALSQDDRTEAAGAVLALFGKRASVPVGVRAAIAVPYLLWLGIWGKD